MNILGIRYGHSASAAITIDGEIVANVMEERFTRIKNDGSFPEKAIAWCLSEANVKSTEIDYIVFPNLFPPLPCFSFFPIANSEYKINYYIKGATKSFEKIHDNDPKIQNKPILPEYIEVFPINSNCEICCVDHHLAHASSAYFTSGIDAEALIFTLDGVGDRVSGTVSIGKGNKISRLETFNEHASLGWFYSAVTEALDWRHGSDEWKVMGLAPYGTPKSGLLDGLYPVFEDGGLKESVNVGGVHRWPDHGSNHYHLNITDKIKERIIGLKAEDVAAEAQDIAENQLLNIVLPWIKKTNIKRACFAGGFFLNVKANQILWYTGELDEQWIYPDPGDSGLPVGCCLFVENTKKKKRKSNRLSNLYHGPSYNNNQIEEILNDRSIKYSYHEYISHIAAKLLSKNLILGWFQGKLEAGPRALGNRSILMSPLKAENKDIINEKVKFREMFRPFCPSILHDARDTYFENARDDYFMISSFRVKKDQKKNIPAVVHVDDTARPQLVLKNQNERYYQLIEQFGELTGHPVVLNTSFNVKGEPIVCTPRDAIRCFYDNGLDALIMGNFLILKYGINL